MEGYHSVRRTLKDAKLKSRFEDRLPIEIVGRIAEIVLKAQPSDFAKLRLTSKYVCATVDWLYLLQMREIKVRFTATGIEALRELSRVPAVAGRVASIQIVVSSPILAQEQVFSSSSSLHSIGGSSHILERLIYPTESHRRTAVVESMAINALVRTGRAAVMLTSVFQSMTALAELVIHEGGPVVAGLQASGYLAARQHLSTPAEVIVSSLQMAQRHVRSVSMVYHGNMAHRGSGVHPAGLPISSLAEVGSIGTNLTLLDLTLTTATSDALFGVVHASALAVLESLPVLSTLRLRFPRQELGWSCLDQIHRISMTSLREFHIVGAKVNTHFFTEFARRHPDLLGLGLINCDFFTYEDFQKVLGAARRYMSLRSLQMRNMRLREQPMVFGLATRSLVQTVSVEQCPANCMLNCKQHIQPHKLTHQAICLEGDMVAKGLLLLAGDA